MEAEEGPTITLFHPKAHFVTMDIRVTVVYMYSALYSRDSKISLLWLKRKNLISNTNCFKGLWRLAVFHWEFMITFFCDIF